MHIHPFSDGTNLKLKPKFSLLIEIVEAYSQPCIQLQMGVQSCLEARHTEAAQQPKKNTQSIEIFPSLSVIGKGSHIQQLHALHCTTTAFCFCAWYKTGLPCHDSQLYCHSCCMHLQWYWWAPFREFYWLWVCCYFLKIKVAISTTMQFNILTAHKGRQMHRWVGCK